MFFVIETAKSEIYNEIHDNHSFVIKAKKMDEQALGSLNTETGKFTDESRYLQLDYNW